MPIKVKRVSEALYVAGASRPQIREDWFTTDPIRSHQLCQELLTRGGSQVDIAGALDEADWNWLNSQEPRLHALP
jgi:hypothetical protein